MWNSSTEKFGTAFDPPQEKLGALDLSGPAEPVMHLSWKVRPVNWSRFRPPPNEEAHSNPENWKSA